MKRPRPLRFYPIRMNKTSWQITNHVLHKCRRSCKRPCPLAGMAELSENPLDNFEGILNLDQVIIPDQVINVYITYPISHIYCKRIDFGNSHVSRLQVLEMIRDVYREIYAEEEATATPINYITVDDCEMCKFHDFGKSLGHACSNDETCPICMVDGELEALPCGHFFHRECAITWLKTRNTCPLCRTIIPACSSCKGRKYVYNRYTTVVIPPVHRSWLGLRNTTDGIHGIYDYDINQLSIKKIYYNHSKKVLTMHIQPI